MLKRWLIRIVFAAGLVVAAIVAVDVATALVVGAAVHHQPADAELQHQLGWLVDRYPALQPLLDRATADGTVTMSEANAIIHAAEEIRRQ